MRRIGTIALIATAGIALTAPSAMAYTQNPDGTFAVTDAELKAAFGDGVDLTTITFDVDGAHTWFEVPCRKDMGPTGKKSVSKSFTRQTHVQGQTKAVRSTSGFTVTVTGTTAPAAPTCPSGWVANGAPRQLAKSQANHLMAVSGSLPVELARS